MKLHEYQAKDLLGRFGVPVLEHGLITSLDEAEDVLARFRPPYAVKAQIHAGGRGKAGGVKLVRDASLGREAVASILGMTLVSPQTGPQGKIVKKVLVEQGCEIDRELYLGLVLDRKSGFVSMLASAEGGMEIEEVASASPEKILRELIDPAAGYQSYIGRKLAFGLALSGKQATAFATCCACLYDAYMTSDASLVEINPLVLTQSDDFIALDAKMSIDDNALYRHPELRALRDIEEEDPEEARAADFGLSYIRLAGNIGCLVNGAGLAMATMDAIQFYGGEPANFLDVGGGADEEKVAEGFKLILSDQNVRGILVNIFGGIMKCDVIARGVVHATRELGLEVPVVVRLEGTNVDLGKSILADSGLKLIPVDGMRPAVQRIVQEVS